MNFKKLFGIKDKKDKTPDQSKEIKSNLDQMEARQVEDEKKCSSV